MDMKDESIDIISLDKHIKHLFAEQKANVSFYKKQLCDYEAALKSLKQNNTFAYQMLSSACENSRSKIHDIQNDISLNLYTIESQTVLKEYHEQIKQPLTVDFLTSSITSSMKEKQHLQLRYTRIFNKYTPDSASKVEINDTNHDVQINNCDCVDFDMVDDNIEVCKSCGKCQPNVIHSTINERVNVSSKYSYERISHFMKCVSQYQGKQNTKIPPIVHSKLEKYFKCNNLLVESDEPSTNRFERYKRVSKQDVYEGLKESNLSKYYNDVFLIHHQITGQPRNDLSHIENSLFKDFETLSNLYDEKYKNEIERSSFLNGKYILYHLLKTYKYPCDDLLFLMLKTHERRAFYDDICRRLFTSLKWNFESAF
jgi:hypothetical protein